MDEYEILSSSRIYPLSFKKPNIIISLLVNLPYTYTQRTTNSNSSSSSCCCRTPQKRGKLESKHTLHTNSLTQKTFFDYTPLNKWKEESTSLSVCLSITHSLYSLSLPAAIAATITHTHKHRHTQRDTRLRTRV